MARLRGRVAVPGRPVSEIRSLDHPGVAVVADLCGDEVFQFRVIGGDEILPLGVEREFAEGDGSIDRKKLHASEITSSDGDR